MKRRSFRFFGVGFIAGFIIFILVTHYIDRRNRGVCFDCAESFGVPFTYLVTGGQLFSERIVWAGVLGNLVIAVLVGLTVGYFVQVLFARGANR